MESPVQTETEQINAAAMPRDIQASNKVYTYSHLPKGNIRLLKLLPHRDISSPLQCSVIDYPLQDLAGSNHHSYNSLSYAWGSPERTRSILIGGCYLPITTNLHAALLRFRHRFVERIIWVDAICINQQDLNERSSQVQRMAMIYALANRVIVWLGEAEDDSDQALEEIYNRAHWQPAREDQKIRNAVLKLLQRPWFKRIWILQEVAAARNVLILCGSSKIDGYIFCKGINSLDLNYAEAPGLQNFIRSATYLIRRKVFQPKQTTSNPSTFSLNIAPLSELIDMYQAREASDCRDKVYALLGMSSNNYSSRGLSPNYDIQWETLFQQVIKLILCEPLSISTWPDKEVAMFKSKCCTLGQVSSVASDATWSDKQNITVSTYTSEGYHTEENIIWTLTLKILANSIQEGDIICLLQGASKATIIRPYKDYFIIIAIAISPATDEQSEKANNSWAKVQSERWAKVLQSVTDFPRDFLLVWDWTKSLSENGEDDKYLLSSQISEEEKTTQLMEKGLSMIELRRYERATDFFKLVIENYTRELKGECSHAIAAAKNIAAVYKNLDRVFDKDERNWRVMADILSGNQDTERLVLDLLRSCDEEVIRLLPDWSWDQIAITEDVLKTAAAAKSKGVMELLLDRRGDQITITEKIVETAAKISWDGKGIIKLLLERRGDEITITEEIVETAAKNSWNGKGIIKLLLERRGDEITITEEIVKAAAGNRNPRDGKEIIKLLLEQRGDEVTITEEIVKAAAGNLWSGEEIIKLLLERRGHEITITEDIINIATANNKAVVKLLRDWKRK